MRLPASLLRAQVFFCCSFRLQLASVPVNTAALRTLLIYAVILPLAVFIGWMVSGDMTRTSFSVLAGIIFLLLVPLLLKWHHEMLIFSWSTSITIFFLPGQPALWMLMAGLNFGIAVLRRIMQKQQAFLPAPAISLSLMALLIVVVVTGNLTGGFGLQILGSSAQGGKRYYDIIAAVIGYFALVSQPIPPARAKFFMALFLLPGSIAAVSNLIYFAGPGFYFLYLIFPVGFAGVQAMSDTAGSVARVAGFSAAASAISYYMMAAYGIRGIIGRWWRVLLLFLVLGVGAMGGYRSLLLLFGLIFIFLFAMEGLLRSPIFPALLLIGALGFAVLIPLAPKLPHSVQRTLSFLPLDIDRGVRDDAEGSVEWRLKMWKAVAPEIPQYFWLGKGYSINPTDLYLAEQAQRYMRTSNFDPFALVGNYHSGPLSVIIPFGIFGVLAFLAFLAASFRVLRLNYRYGSDQMRIYNRFFFAYFLSKVIFFFIVFGSLFSDMYVFTGLVGFSVALNHGVCRKPVLAQRPVIFRGRMEFAARSGAA